MKTPREVWLERHQAVRPKLEALGREVIRSELSAETRPGAAQPSWLSLAWRELIWPYRRVWAGLGAVWLLIFVAQFSVADHTQAAAVGASGRSGATILAFWQQEQVLAEWVEPRPHRVVAPVKPATVQPRSQRRADISAV